MWDHALKKCKMKEGIAQVITSNLFSSYHGPIIILLQYYKIGILIFYYLHVVVSMPLAYERLQDKLFRSIEHNTRKK